MARVYLLTRLVVCAVAALLGWALTAPAATGAYAAPPSAGYAYNCEHAAVALNDASTDRGPPGALGRHATSDAVDRWSNGASVCPGPTTQLVAYEYGHPSVRVRVAHVASATSRSERATPATPSPLARSGVAANTANRAGRAYPEVLDPRTGSPIHFPGEGLTKVPASQRVPWGSKERGAYIKDCYDRAYSTPEGGWSGYDIHHIRPREYGGTNDFDNLVPIPRDVHQQQFNTWWRDY